MSLPTFTAIPHTPKDLHGANGICAVTSGSATTLLSISTVSLSHDPGLEDVTSSGGGGWRQSIPGVNSISGTLVLCYDFANAPLLAPYTLQAGKLLATLYIVPDGQLGPSVVPLAITDTLKTQAYYGAAYLSGFKFDTGPKAGATMISCDYISEGPWTLPNVAPSS